MADGQATETRYGLEYIATVMESRPLTPSCHGIRVTRHPRFDYKPVQFTFLSLRTEEADDWSDYRPMSLASSPTREHLEYGVRLSGSAWKRAFQALRPGDEVMVEGPAGHFILDETRPAVFIAGGIGITPLKGMVEYAADKRLDVPVRLLYSNRSEDEIAYRKELDDAARANPGFRVVHTLTRGTGADWEGRRGRIDGALLAETAADLDEPVYYVCGAPGMVEEVARTLLDQGVAREAIRYEQFWGY